MFEQMNVCAKCGAEKALAVCKTCVRIASAKYRAANAEKIKAYDAAFRAANKEKCNAAVAKWRAANPEKVRAGSAKWSAKNPQYVRAKSAKWAKAHPETVRIKSQNYRARKHAAGGTLSKDITERLFKLQKGKCACGCKQSLGGDYHLDHRMPLALGGANEDRNMQLLRSTCNQQKHAKHPIDFMQQRGFLL